MRVSPRIREWLLGPASDPSVRWRFLSEVEGRPPTDARVRAARRAIGRSGWAEGILAHQFPDGRWATPGSSDPEIYRPKYISTYWRFLVLADLGMTRADPRIRHTAELVLRRWTEKGTDLLGGPESEICSVGNSVRALVRYGYLDHPVVQRCIDWTVRTQKRDGGWYCFPGRSSGSIDGWEGLAALAEIPEDARDDRVRRSIERGAEFFLRHRLMDEGSTRYPPWFRIHFPTHYYYDLLVGLRILTGLGYGADSRLRPALRWLLGKRRRDGTWALDADHPDLDPQHGGYVFDEGPVWPMRLEPPGEPSRWATGEALGVLSRAGMA
ncbi:MAG TPA: prenyltransferase/squalene oxidase repeat-containing protein [Thermoplasmata archaeon]|nr:prenyltransferase/squalene oxidase repeat-containing protein [Thermoplasmata archaeon]